MENATVNSFKHPLTQGGVIRYLCRMNWNKWKQNGIVKLLTILWQVLGRYVLSEKKVFSIAFLLSTLAAVCSLMAPYLISLIIDKALPDKDFSRFLWYSAGLVATFVAFYVFWAWHVKAAVKASQDIFLRLKEDLIASILCKPVSFFHRYSSSEMLTRLSNDMDYLSNFFYERVIQTFVDDLFSGVILIFILVWNWKLGLFAVVAIVFYMVFISLIQEPISKRATESRKKLSAQNEVLMDIVSGHREIRFFQQHRQAIARFATVIHNFRDAGIREITYKDLALTAVDSVNILLTLSPFIFGGMLICFGHDDISVGVLVAYNAYFTYLTEKMLSVAEGYASLSQAIPAFLRIREIFDYPEEAVVQNTNIEDAPDTTDIVFEHISFSYNGSSTPIFNDLNLTIRSGDKVAVTGASGKGKSTAIQLLLRFIKPDSGRILMDGRDISAYSLPLYLSYFSYVSQSTYLFNLSIRENIAMGWPNTPHDLIVRAAKIVRMHEVIELLPSKYETVIREKGFNLSGGQTQRIALARAFIRDPEILVLDEFTSALDPHTEAQILDEIFDIFSDKTIVCVTHSMAVAHRFSRRIDL